MIKRLFLTFIFLFFNCLIFISCTKKPTFDMHESDVQLVDELPDDFVVPNVVWESMKPKIPDEKEKAIIYTSVKVFMKEKNKGVLKKPLLGFEFGRGGGDLDLSTVLGNTQGTFFVGFELPELENALQKKAFFVSQSRQRKVDGEILGSGCNLVLDLSTELYKQSKETGIKINTTRYRHDSIMGGHLILLGETEKNWLMTQVTFFDSTREDLFCKGFRSADLGVH
jgi:hypothetical protein